MNLALEVSSQQSAEARDALIVSQAAVTARLQPLGLERLSTPMDGNCQFIALAFSANAPILHDQLRQQICQYMLAMKDFFGSLFDLRWGNFEAYVAHMEVDGSYGSECTLQAAAHLFLRPVQVIGENPEIDRKFLPPESVSEEIWGPEVVLAYVAWNHYEATAALANVKTQRED